MLLALLLQRPFSSVTLYRVSPEELDLTLLEADPSYLFVEFLDASTEAVLFSENCEYYAEFSRPTIHFRNSSCVFTNQSFYKLILRGPSLQANVTIYVDRVIEDIDALGGCISRLELFHDVNENVKLWLKLACPHIPIDTNITVALANENTQVFEAQIGGLTNVMTDVNISLMVDDAIRRSIIYDYNYLLNCTIFAAQTVILVDVCTNNTVPVEQYFELSESLRNSFFDGHTCFTGVLVSSFEKDVLVRFQEGSLCTPGAGSYYEAFDAEVLLAQLVIEWADTYFVFEQEATAYNFGQFEYEYSCVDNCDVYQKCHERIIGNENVDIQFNALFVANSARAGIVRHTATLITPVFQYLTAYGYKNRVCIVPGWQPLDPAPILKEYNLLFRRSIRNSKYSNIKPQYYFSFSDFYPLDKYCFEVPEKKLVYTLFKAEYDIIFIVDDQKYYIYNFEPYIQSQYGFLALGLTLLMMVLLAVVMVVLKSCYRGVS